MSNSLIQKASLANQVEQIMVERIKSGFYPVGEKLPSEIQLAEEFDVSKATVRAAVNALTARRLVVRRQGVGTFVSQSAKLANPLDQSYDFLHLIASNGYAANFREVFSKIVVPDDEVDSPVLTQ